MMVAARIRRAAPLFPFGAEPGRLLVGGPTLRSLQDDAVAAAAGAASVVDVDAGAILPGDVRVAFDDDAVFTRATVRALLHSPPALRPGKVVQAAVRQGTPLWQAVTRMAPAAADCRVPLWAGALGGRAAAGFDDAELAVVCDEDGAVVWRVPPHGREGVLRLADVERVGGRVAHWVDLLELSMAVLRARTRGLGDRNERRGKVQIHPTATVLGSILEDGVRIEPHASVIGCHLGKRVVVADHSTLHTCVVGDDCRTLVDTSIRRSVAMPDATLSNIFFADSVVGAGVFLTTGVTVFNVGAPGGADAVVDGVDTRRATIGVALGTRSILGTRALFKAGTALPPGLLVVAKPDEAVSKLDDESLARATTIRGDPRENF